MDPGTIASLGGVFLLVLGVSFMFRVLGLLKRIADGIDALRSQPEKPASMDPDIAAHIARKRQGASEAERFHFR